MHHRNLRQLLVKLDNRSYKAYKDIQGSYDFGDFTLIVEYVQGDPFAAPSKLWVRIPQSVAGFPRKLYQSRSREVALRDYLTREFSDAAREVSTRRGTGKSGQIAIARVTQEVLERTAAFVNEEFIEIRFTVGLPAKGRRILGYQAAEMLCEDIPQIVEEVAIYAHLDGTQIQQHVETVEDADWLRSQLRDRGLVAFVANDAILPRRSGIDDRPLSSSEAVPFVSPPSLEVQFDCPNRGKISGMGIPAGVTLIVGGGYHGKSTLLKAIERGVYDHIPGDGREFVLTDPAAMKIRAEDGRSVVGVDISPFINHLPQKRSTRNFSTTNASGSTSQAANIMEALEAQARVLLVDEDTAATNFMIRDRRMQTLIAKEKEPITPFIDKVQQLADSGVSTILVMGGSGDYFDVASVTIAMENFQVYDVTEKAKAIAREYTTGRTPEGGDRFGEITPRIPRPKSLDPSKGKRDVRLKVRDVDEVMFGTEDIDLGSVEQIVERCQLQAIAAAMVYAKEQYMDGQRSLAEILDAVMEDIDSQGLDILTRFPEGDLAMFRRFELAAALNRLRTLEVS